jgi:hypothetical protein
MCFVLSHIKLTSNPISGKLVLIDTVYSNTQVIIWLMINTNGDLYRHRNEPPGSIKNPGNILTS